MGSGNGAGIDQFIKIEPGSIVRYNIWHGVVARVYHSTQDDDDSTLVEIFFVKNVFKMQQPEIVPLTDALQPALLEDLQAHALAKLMRCCQT